MWSGDDLAGGCTGRWAAWCCRSVRLAFPLIPAGLSAVGGWVRVFGALAVNSCCHAGSRGQLAGRCSLLLNGVHGGSVLTRQPCTSSNRSRYAASPSLGRSAGPKVDRSDDGADRRRCRLGTAALGPRPDPQASLLGQLAHPAQVVSAGERAEQPGGRGGVARWPRSQPALEQHNRPVDRQQRPVPHQLFPQGIASRGAASALKVAWANSSRPPARPASSRWTRVCAARSVRCGDGAVRRLPRGGR